ncbi:hypothetical protein [Streptomyces sp. NPDC001404]|uniref:hypothetical protein n=1 Tax=Streptomyces sp. NPDC001404 TaxID=3364571 RepID=UPI0036A2F1CE
MPSIPAMLRGTTARFNESFARRATLVFGTVWMFYLLTAYGLLPLLLPAAINQLLYWSNCVQLIALPLLMVGTNILGRDSERRALETHDAVMEELLLLRQSHEAQQEKIAELHAFHIQGRLPDREIKP